LFAYRSNARARVLVPRNVGRARSGADWGFPEKQTGVFCKARNHMVTAALTIRSDLRRPMPRDSDLVNQIWPKLFAPC
jgi:hypothetical protein